MKPINSNVLLEELMADVRQIILEVNKLEGLLADKLETQPETGGWSVAQILEHLNFYSRYYLKAIEEKLHRNQLEPAIVFKPGWLGSYFTKMMKPADDNTIKNKMKTMKNAVPPPQPNGKAALAQFISDQHALLNLLKIAQTANLNKLRIPISITKLITLNLGDTFRFFIAHEQRHMVQLRNVLRDISA